MLEMLNKNAPMLNNNGAETLKMLETLKKFELLKLSRYLSYIERAQFQTFKGLGDRMATKPLNHALS